MRDLREIQDELDEKKYRSSVIARCDMSGKMEYCFGCIFRNDRHECEIPHEVRKEYSVCVRQKEKQEKEVQNVKLTIQPRKTRKRSDG